MATATTLAARTTAQLTGNGTADYASDLDMNLTLDGEVTVEITGTKGSLTNIITSYHAGPSASPTGVIASGTAVQTETITDASWTRVVTLPVRARYFRVAVTGTGADPSSSDAVINYYYSANAITDGLVDGVNVATT
jgi:hypothetical protein